MLKAVAVDDETMALEVIKKLSLKVPFMELTAVFTDAFEALAFLQQNTIDILFLDIRMPDISGIDFLQSLSRPPMIVFTTAHSEHAVQSFELNVVDYLLKPFSLPRFLKACSKAHQLYKLHELDTTGITLPAIFIKSVY
jgi:two-component system LytT family response regulator